MRTGEAHLENTESARKCREVLHEKNKPKHAVELIVVIGGHLFEVDGPNLFTDRDNHEA